MPVRINPPSINTPNRGTGTSETGTSAEDCFATAMEKNGFRILPSCPQRKGDKWDIPDVSGNQFGVARATRDQDYTEKTDFWFFDPTCKGKNLGYEGWFRIQFTTEWPNAAKTEAAYSQLAIPIFIPYGVVKPASIGGHEFLDSVDESFAKQLKSGFKELKERNGTGNFKEAEEKRRKGNLVIFV